MLIVPLNTKGVDSNGLFYGYASVFNIVDYDGDVVVQGAFQSSLQTWQEKKKKPSMLWQHDPHMEIGTWHAIEEDVYGLTVTGQIDLTSKAGQHVYRLVQAGDIKGLSIGFVPLHTFQRNGYRYISDVDLHEVSIVSEACNRMACITSCMPGETHQELSVP